MMSPVLTGFEYLPALCFGLTSPMRFAKASGYVFIKLYITTPSLIPGFEYLPELSLRQAVDTPKHRGRSSSLIK